MYLWSNYTDLSLAEIGSIFGKDISTVMHGISKVEKWLENDRQFAEKIEMIIRECNDLARKGEDDMGFNPADLFKIKGAANKFNENHPRFLPFMNAVKGTVMTPGTVIEITVTDSSGEETKTNLRVQESDIELFKIIADLA